MTGILIEEFGTLAREAVEGSGDAGGARRSAGLAGAGLLVSA